LGLKVIPGPEFTHGTNVHSEGQNHDDKTVLRKFKFESLDKVEDVKPVIEIITR
jgi:hypothetical protein